MPDPAVVSLAILKVNWDLHRKDYLENFVPLAAECVKDLAEEVISLSALQDKMRDLFGIRLPQGTLDRLLNRLRQKGFVQIKNHTYFRNLESLRGLDFQKVRHQVLAMHEALVRSLISFCRESHGITWDEPQAEAALQAFLNDNQFILTTKRHGSIIPLKTKRPESARYLVASFIQNILDSGGAEKEYLDTIAKGHMLANSIFLPEEAKLAKKFVNTKLFLDTSFILYSLGYGGESRRLSRSDLIMLLRDTGAELRCFSHTLDEIRGILTAMALKISHGEIHDLYGPSADYFLTSGFSSSDILLLSNRLPQEIAKLGIKVVEKPDYVKTFMIDEQELQDNLSDAYRNPQALQRDIDSVSAIMRLREDKDAHFVEESRALFVTTNSFLAEKAAAFFIKKLSRGSFLRA